MKKLVLSLGFLKLVIAIELQALKLYVGYKLMNTNVFVIQIPLAERAFLADNYGLIKKFKGIELC